MLNTRERLLFLEHCKREAETAKTLLQQLEKLGSMPQIVQLQKQRAAAYSFVAMDLALVREQYSVGSEDVGEI